MDMAVADKVVVAGIAVVDHTLVADTLVAAAVDHMVEEDRLAAVDIVGAVVHKVVAYTLVVGLVVVHARFHLVVETDKVVRFWAVVARCQNLVAVVA